MRLAVPILVALLPGLVSAAASDPAKCVFEKQDATGTYVRCRLKAEGQFAKHGDAAKRDTKLEACAARFSNRFDKAERRYGNACPSTGDADPTGAVAASFAQQVVVSTSAGFPPVGAGFCGPGTHWDPPSLQCVPGAPGPICGNGIVEGDEQCDGADLGDHDTCFDAFGGYHPDFQQDECTGALGCAADCTYDGSACSCTCEEDFDCTLPDGVHIDCSPFYCTTDFCAPADIGTCSCSLGRDGDIDGACLGSDIDTGALGLCVTSPFDAGPGNQNLVDLCTGDDGGDPDFPRCDHCDF